MNSRNGVLQSIVWKIAYDFALLNTLAFWALALHFACLGLHIRPKITQVLEASIEGDFVLDAAGPLMDFAQPLCCFF